MATAEQLRVSIEREKQDRIRKHQARIAAGRRMGQMLEALTPPALNLFAQGDSWFDYPFPIPKINQSDIVAHLKRLPSKPPEVLSLAVAGEATEDMLGTKKLRELRDHLVNPENGKFDAILFSGGGNDLAGDQFRLWLVESTSVESDPNKAINSTRLQGILKIVAAGYEDLIAERNKVDKSIPIFGHSYDFAIPNGTKVPCAGPWLQPGFQDRGWLNLSDNRAVVKRLLEEFNSMLERFAAKPENNFILIKTQ